MLAAVPAQADPLTVSNAQTSPIATGTAANGTPGDITVSSGGSVIVSDVVPAVTVNSNNNLTNSGTIQSSAASGATAVLVSSATPLSTTINNSATIGVTGSGGSGNYGIRVTGAGMNGSIVSTSASTLSVLGDNSYGLSVEAPVHGNISANSFSLSGANSIGVSITAPVTGNVTITGTNGSSGAGATGVLIAAPVSGTLDLQGSVTGGQVAQTITNADGSTTSVPATPGLAGIHIASNLGGGFLNDYFYVDSKGNVVATSAVTSADTLVKGTISETAGTPGVLISPLAANGTDVVLSPVGAAGTNDAYGFVNRGSISSASATSGLSATAIRIAGASSDGLTSNVILDGGFVNQSTGALTVNTTEGTATGISIGANAQVPTIVNQGSIDANGSITTPGKMASAFAINIDPGAQVGSINNSGSIGAQVSSSGASGPATAIFDRSGSLASITNSGTITATAVNSGDARAIDLTAGTGPQSITNSGTITGNVLFGSGNATYASNSGKLSGALVYGSGANQLSLDGNTAFNSPVTIASGGSLGVTLAGTSSLNLGATPPVLSSLSATGQSALSVPVAETGNGLTVTGAASFTGQSVIKLDINQQVGTTPIPVLTAGGGITTDHFSTLINGTSTPFIYTLDNYAINGNQLEVTLHRKSGAEVGFSPGTAPLYEASFAAFGNGPTFQAIANLPDQKSVLGAYRQIEPPGFGTMPIRLAQDLQSAGSGIVRGRLDGLAISPPGASGTVDDRAKLSPWIAENVSLMRQKDSVADPGFKSDTFDISVGADYALTRTFAVGIAGTFAWNDIHMAGMTSVENKPFSVNSLMGDIYAGWNSGVFFIQAVAGYAHNHYNFHRQISIDTLSLTQVARWNGYQFSGDVVGGARFKFGRWTITPSDAFTYIKLHQSGYAMTGGGDIDLVVDGKSDKASLNTAKLSFGYRLPLSEDTAVEIALHGGYIVHLDNHVNPLTAQFSAGGSPFEMSTVAYKKSAFEEGGSVAYVMPGFYLGLVADHSQQSQFTDTSASVTLRTAF
jgi:hypothetical protein